LLPGPENFLRSLQEAGVARAVPQLRFPWLRSYGLRLIFFFAYAMMMLLIVEQGRVIEAQRMLIRQLYPDSVQLSSLRAHLRARH
jgi:hypothetical protein